MKASIRHFIERGGDFDTTACALFRWQVERNPHYARIAGAAAPRRAADIPSVPVALFKSLALRSFPPDAPALIFRTSGTTGSVRGEHHLEDSTLYDLATVANFRARVPDAPVRIVSLCPDEADSSLGHMLRCFGEVEPCFSAAGIHEAVWDRLHGTLFLASTAFALDALFAGARAARLGPESLVMVTGGFKGRTVRLDQPALYTAIAARLGAPRVVAEYGMSELSSQLWSAVVPAGEVPRTFSAPPWLRVYTVDPASGEPVDGVGLLRFVDLCNVDSVLAIETLDLGEVHREPGRGDEVTLHGRLDGAEARGCSLRAEDLLLRSHTT